MGAESEVVLREYAEAIAEKPVRACSASIELAAS